MADVISRSYVQKMPGTANAVWVVMNTMKYVDAIAKIQNRAQSTLERAVTANYISRKIDWSTLTAAEVSALEIEIINAMSACPVWLD